MNEQKVAAELVKISKTLVGGGGAGIKFTVDISDGVEVPLKYQPGLFMEDGDITVGKVRKMPNVDSFSAKGYQDGDRNVSGRLMKVVSVDLDEDRIKNEVEQFIIDWIDEDAGESPGDYDYEVSVYFSEFETMIFRGYVRGTLDAGDILTLEGQAEVEVLLDGTTESSRPFFVDATIDIKVTGQMEDWYYDTFIATKDEED